MNNKNILAVITARGGSKRIPKKNIKEFLGKPIIAYSIEAARETNIFSEIMVSTDSDEIADVARSYGALIPFMRSEKASDDFATTNDVIKEVIEEYKKRGKIFDLVVCIYPTAPFVTAKKIIDAIEILTDGNYDAVTPVVRFSFPPQRAMIIRNAELIFQYPEKSQARSQDLEPIYHDCGQFYVLKPDNVYKSVDELSVAPIIMPESEVQDIDCEEDWKLAEMKYRLMID